MPRLCSLLLTAILSATMATKTVQSAELNCPMQSLVELIEKTQELISDDVDRQMEAIQRVAEKMYGCTWGVVINDADIDGLYAHWKIQVPLRLGKLDYCHHVHNGKAFMVFRTQSCEAKDQLGS